MIKELTNVNISNNIEKLDHVIALVDPLVDAWVKVSMKPKAEAVEKAAGGQVSESLQSAAI